MNLIRAAALAIIATPEPLKSPRFGYACTAVLAIAAVYYAVRAAIEDSRKSQ